jgi:L-ascorbate metabolism protein UlaG (beta-lactamase superfamily)
VTRRRAAPTGPRRTGVASAAGSTATVGAKVIRLYDGTPMARIRFLGVAGYEIVSSDQRILIDPFLSGSPLAPCSHEELETPDVVLVSHAAYDHFGDAAEIALRTGAPVVCGGDVRLMLIERGVPPGQIRATVWGLVARVGGVTVRPLECHHWSMGTLADGPVTGTPLAFIVEPEDGIRIYHYGDTAIFDMRLFGELYRPTVGIFGCTDPVELPDDNPGELMTGEMDPDEAAYAAEMLGVDVAIAAHYLSPTPAVTEFLARVPARDSTGRRQAVAPAVGQWLVVERRGERVVATLEQD